MSCERLSIFIVSLLFQRRNACLVCLRHAVSSEKPIRAAIVFLVRILQLYLVELLLHWLN